MKRLTGSLVACLAALAGPARADVLYPNLGPGESYAQNGGWFESGPDTAGAVRQAFAFTVSGTDTSFDGARLALGLAAGPNEIDLRLYDTAGGQPGAVLEDIHVSGRMPPLMMYGSGHSDERRTTCSVNFATASGHEGLGQVGTAVPAGRWGSRPWRGGCCPPMPLP
jgi:hypothetical protein